MRLGLLYILPTLAPALADALDEGPVGKITLIGALVGAIFAYQKRWIVPGALYADLQKQNEELRRANEQLRQLVHQATGTAQQALAAEPPKIMEGG